jgi:hypothetical protein
MTDALSQFTQFSLYASRNILLLMLFSKLGAVIIQVSNMEKSSKFYNGQHTIVKDSDNHLISIAQIKRKPTEDEFDLLVCLAQNKV